MLGSQWSKKELENFYKAYRKYGMDWKKVASSVHSRTAEIVVALYSMNKAYLSLPDRVGSVAGFIAMMIDHYNMLDISNSDGGSSEEYEGSKHPKQQSRSNNKLSNANSSDDCYLTMHTRSLPVFGCSPPGKKRTGEKLVPPYARRGIIPLAIPLSEDQSGAFTALLRWPTSPEGMEMPVVRVQKYGVSLLAKTVDQYIHRILVEEDCNGYEDAANSLYAASGDAGKKLYKQGDVAESKIENLDVYLTKKVALFPDVFERIALGHLERGDQVSALVTGELYVNRKHFPGFGRPFVFNAELFLKIGRKLEAKDAAKVALKLPWWTIGCRYEEVAKIAGWGDEQIEYMRERVTDEGRHEDLRKGKAPAQVALDQAAFLMDLASLDGSWHDIQDQLAAYYKEAGLDTIARFILYDC